MRQQTIKLPSGRELQVAEGGAPGGLPIFFLHGTPGARILHGPSSEYAASKGIRLIGYDRPGYGGSTQLWGRTVGSTSRDVAAIADNLGIQRFAVYGWSGGGAPSLACAALLPGRVVAAASLAAVAPYPAEGLDWLAGAGELNVKDFLLMLNHRWSWGRSNRKEAKEMLAATADQLRESMRSLLSDVDRTAFSAEFASFLYQQTQEGLRQGDAGMRDDNLSLIRPWGFNLASIRVPVQIWHGGQDRFVPVSHGQWIAARVPKADVHLLPNEGHITLFLRHSPTVMNWLASKF